MVHGNLYIPILGELELGVIVVYLVEEVLKQDRLFVYETILVRQGTLVIGEMLRIHFVLPLDCPHQVDRKVVIHKPVLIVNTIQHLQLQWVRCIII